MHQKVTAEPIKVTENPQVSTCCHLIGDSVLQSRSHRAVLGRVIGLLVAFGLLKVHEKYGIRTILQANHEIGCAQLYYRLQSLALHRQD